MRLLLDTHVALRAITDHPGMSAKARELILAPDSTIWVSAVTVWEISIKSSLGRGRGGMPVSGKLALDKKKKREKIGTEIKEEEK